MFKSDEEKRTEAHLRTFHGSGKSSTGEDVGGGILGLLMKLFMAIGKVVGWILGGIVGLILKLGIVGKVLTTALLAVFIYLFVAITGALFEMHETVLGIIAIICGLGAGFWFWMFHYKTVKHMPLRDFSSLMAKCFSICFYGTIIAYIALWLLGFEEKLGQGGTFSVSLILPFIVAVIRWLWVSKDYKPEFDIDDLKAGAKKGDPVAMYHLGEAYFKGEGVKPDNTKAFEWYKKAAEQGYAKAQYVVGVIYIYEEHGELFGVSKDIRYGVSWLKKSAEQGFQDAIEDLETLEQNVSELDINEVLEEAKKGDPASQYFLAAAYYDGHKIEQDYAKSFEWYRKSAEQRYADAEYVMGLAYYAEGVIDKFGMPFDETIALSWFKKAAKQGHKDAIELVERLTTRR